MATIAGLKDTHLLKSCRDSIFEKNRTGQSTAINNGEEDQETKKISKYFDQLDPILRDQPSCSCH